MTTNLGMRNVKAFKQPILKEHRLVELRLILMGGTQVWVKHKPTNIKLRLLTMSDITANSDNKLDL